MSGFDGAGLVLGLVEVVHDADGGAHDGIAWMSDHVSYTVDQRPVPGDELAVRAAVFSAYTVPGESASATFVLHGVFGSAEGAPEMADCRILCADHHGWGQWFGLSVGFHGLPTAVGTADDPRLRFQCHAELAVAGDGHDCHVNFVIEVDRFGAVEVESYEFEYGEAAVTIGNQFQLYYDVR